ncbi:OmpA family protein [Tunicatimonas pelagia]|uniref:OmpA family protein n=1 Tax=Tunicatimonas pelagia TaxID=931531 RepID=UPI0026655E5C|nr:OmpA family protein [Tunicatimonas pelagia]WKN41939.1 OmpA family protein [Tunicatimonas pelagia]
MPRLILIFLISLSLSGVAQAQSVKRLLKTADKYYEHGFYYEAAINYKKAADITPDDLSITYKIGLAYLKSRYKHRAMPFLEEVYENTQDSTSTLVFHLGLAYQYNHQFEKALEYFHYYRKNAENTYTVDRHIRQCNIGIEYVNNPKNVEIRNLKKLNSDNQDYAPLITSDGKSLIFTSRREGSTGGKKAYDDNYYEDIYIVRRNKGDWLIPEKISTNINTHYHECGAAISPDGKTLFIYVDEGDGDIYFSTYQNKEWSVPLPVSQYVNSPYRELSVSVNQAGDELYFSSNRPGGFGGFDLYVSRKDRRGEWGPPENLGPKINTEADEDAPFIHPSGKSLFFSSKGHMGMGGYDIFQSRKYQGKWSTPINMGYPINTAQDDIYFVTSADNALGYYATAREDGMGGNDLYVINMKPKKAAPKPVAAAPVKNTTYFIGKVTDAGSGNPVAAELILSDNRKNIIIDRQYSDPSTGEFKISIPEGENFGLIVEAEGYLFYSTNFGADQLKGRKEIKRAIQLDKAVVGSVTILKNIFFDTGKASIKQESISELDRVHELLKANPNLKIQINGHTDNVGEADYNQKLSEQRAKAVASYLLQYGTTEAQVVAKGFGETRPLVSNDDEFGGREINRRTEIEILSVHEKIEEKKKGLLPTLTF